jgi:hypothetical protein
MPIKLKKQEKYIIKFHYEINQQGLLEKEVDTLAKIIFIKDNVSL